MYYCFDYYVIVRGRGTMVASTQGWRLAPSVDIYGAISANEYSLTSAIIFCHYFSLPPVHWIVLHIVNKFSSNYLSSMCAVFSISNIGVLSSRQAPWWRLIRCSEIRWQEHYPCDTLSWWLKVLAVIYDHLNVLSSLPRTTDNQFYNFYAPRNIARDYIEIKIGISVIDTISKCGLVRSNLRYKRIWILWKPLLFL